jgi:hypothetical protein
MLLYRVQRHVVLGNTHKRIHNYEFYSSASKGEPSQTSATTRNRVSYTLETKKTYRMRFYGTYTSVTAVGTVSRMEEQKRRREMTDARSGM